MLDRHVQAALAAGIAAGDEDVARRSLPRDPVARIFARRRLERSLIDAALVCDGAGLARPPAAHVMRVAALMLEGPATVAPSNERGIAAAYAALPPVTAPRLPVWTIAAALVSLALVGAAVLYLATLPGKASRTYARPLPPPTAAAFRDGGVPLRDAAIDALLAEQLTKLVVDAGRARRTAAVDAGGLVAPLREAAPIAAHGAPLARAWRDMLDVFARSVDAVRRADGPTQRERDEIREAVRDLSQRFAEVGLGYFLEGRFKSGFVYVQAYRVEQVVFVVAGGKPRRVLSLRRLDRLNTSYAALGLHNEAIGDPLLMLDQIDENVASTVLPVLAKDALYPLADRGWLVTATGKALAGQIGGVVRAELGAALGEDAAAVERIAALLVERGELIEQWRDALARKQIRFVATDDLFLPPELLEQLTGVISTHQRERVMGIEAELARLEGPRIHARVHDLVAATVRRHEAQHGFDYDREAELRYPEALSAMLGSSHDDAGEAVPVVRSARAELAAYLSQVANDPLTPQASLWHLGRQVFDRERAGTGEFYAGVVVLEGLARSLGAPMDGPTFQRGLDRERMAGLARLIASQPVAALRIAAAALWMDLYGEPVTPIVEAPAPGAGAP